jgi:hypothetical protein
MKRALRFLPAQLWCDDQELLERRHIRIVAGICEQTMSNLEDANVNTGNSNKFRSPIFDLYMFLICLPKVIP